LKILILLCIIPLLGVFGIAHADYYDYLIYQKNGTYYTNSTGHVPIIPSGNFSDVMYQAISNIHKVQVYGIIDILGNATITNEINVTRGITINSNGYLTSNTAHGKGIFNLNGNEILLNLHTLEGVDPNLGRDAIIFTYGTGQQVNVNTIDGFDVGFWLPMTKNQHMYGNFFNLGHIENSNWGIRGEAAQNWYNQGPQGNYFTGFIEQMRGGGVILQCGIPYQYFLSKFDLQIDNGLTNAFAWQHCNNDRIMVTLNLNDYQNNPNNKIGNQDHGIINYSNATVIR